MASDASAADLAVAARALSQAAQALQRAVCLRLQAHGLAWAEAAVLMVLHQHGPQSRTALARALHAGRRRTTARLDRMEQAGWITRRRRTTNRRSVSFLLTIAGLEAATVVDDIIAEVATQAFAGMADADLALLRSLLPRP